MTEPFVSISCITYNHENFIRDAIEGFLMQITSFPIEILIHDDASTDRTADIIREYEAKYPDIIKPIYQTENQHSKHDGSIGRIQRERAKGKYYAPCEGDDYWTDPLKLQKQVDFLEANPEYSLSYCRFQTLNEETGEFQNDMNGAYFANGDITIDFDFEKFYKGWHMGTQTLVYRKNMFDSSFRSHYKYFRDIHLITHLLLKGKGVCFSFFGAVYRKHKGGIYSGLTELKKSEIGYLCYKEIYEHHKQVLFLKLKYIKFTHSFIDKLLINNNFKKAFIISLEILRIDKNFKHATKIFKFILVNRFKIIKFNLLNRLKSLFKQKKKPKHPSFYKKVKTSGIISVKRNPAVIISLTSYPKRMKTIHLTLNTLLNQSLKPDKLILWLANDQFPRKEKDIPGKVLKLKKYGLTIEWCEDLKSYKKLIPALKKYPDEIIVTVDDDAFYMPDMLEELFISYNADKSCIYAHRAHKINFDKEQKLLPYRDWEWCSDNQEKSLLNFCTGVGGVLYPPHSLPNEVLNEELFIQLAPTADDVWFWAMAVLNGTKICIVKNKQSKPILVPESQTEELGIINFHNGGNDKQLSNVFKKYPKIYKTIMEEYLSSKHHQNE